MDSSPSTELEAVNLMLSTIGEAPVNSVETGGVGDVPLAISILSWNRREVQQIGWHWNTEDDYVLQPTTDGEIMLPINTLKVDTSGVDESLDLIQRGNRLYDRKAHSYIIGRPANVSLVLNLPFDQIPEAARAYITIRSARQFQARVLGSAQAERYTKEDEWGAMVLLKHAEAEIADHNILTDSATVSNIVNRRMR